MQPRAKRPGPWGWLSPDVLCVARLASRRAASHQKTSISTGKTLKPSADHQVRQFAFDNAKKSLKRGRGNNHNKGTASNGSIPSPRKTKQGTKESTGNPICFLSLASLVTALPPLDRKDCGLRNYSETTKFSADDLPFWPGTSSNSTFCPSLRVVRPARSTAEIWTKASLDPSSGSIKP